MPPRNNRPYVRPPFHVSGCEMAHFNTGKESKAYYMCVFNLVLDIHVMVNCQLSKTGIRSPVSHDCIAGLGLQLMEVVYF